MKPRCKVEPLQDPLAVRAAKKELRVKAKAVRAAAFHKHGASAFEQIAARGLAFAAPPQGAVVSAFTAIGEELDPEPLLQKLHREGYVLALPVMIGKGQPLIFRRWQPGDPLKETLWGIREPLDTAPQIEPQVVLAALLAFDRKGYRLGYGGGFYDRTLAAARANRPVLAVGLAYDEQEVDAVPYLDYDQKLDWVLTPSRTIKCVTS
jgi:5-formyltetrahydrofolate cyclo-ligase